MAVVLETIGKVGEEGHGRWGRTGAEGGGGGAQKVGEPARRLSRKAGGSGGDENREGAVQRAMPRVGILGDSRAARLAGGRM